MAPPVSRFIRRLRRDWSQLSIVQVFLRASLHKLLFVGFIFRGQIWTSASESTLHSFAPRTSH